ncbi:hypothetical protein QYE76_035738 [Lolium multiflorum]|uniref:Uncharacterized protein n=1 Tax=Lolium multiflorum TaxID=4521 RepID=A0AAD8VPA2_LOLMU|nr:hypothetical protein QYE76_035738 [Lolium multiflorum]
MATTDLGSSEWERSKISAQDINMLKKMGFSKKENSLQFPKEESYPRPPIDYRRIFCLRRNGSHNVAYNIGGVVICVRSDVEYFDVKFPDSVQGWRKKWLYIHEESSNPVEENIAPFDGEAKILRRRSWDAEATEDEKLATEALMTRIHELQNTRSKELSGIEITAYFLRARVQPLQARKNPFWKYAGEKDVDRLSKDLPLKDFEKLIHKISSLNKKDPVPSSCRITPYSSANPLPEVEKLKTVLSSMMITKAPRALPVKLRVLTNPRLLLNLKPLLQHTPILLLPQRTRGKGVKSKIPAPPMPKKPILQIGRQLSIHTPMPSSALMMRKNNLLTRLLKRPLMKEFIRLGTQFVGYRDHSKKLEGELAEANNHANALAAKLEQSEKARKNAEADAAAVEDLRKRLHDAETSLSENIQQQSARETEILSRLESQCRRFVRRTHQDYEVDGPIGDELLDALTLLEIHGDEAREGLADAGLSKLFPYFFPKKEEPNTFVALAKAFNVPEDLGLKLRQEGLKIGVEGTIALIADSQQNIDWTKVGDIREMETKEWQSLIKAAKPPSKPILSFLGVKPTPAPSTSKPEVK